MTELAGDLVPLIIASAVLPLQTVLALVLARSSLRAAYAWVAGMLVVRFAQGIVFGFILAPTETRAGSGPRYVLGAVLLVLSLARTSIRGSRLTGNASRSTSAIRTRTSGCSTSNARR